MDREDRCGHLRPFLKAASALLLLVIAIPSVKAQISTARCAWTIDEADQGRTRCAKGPGPASAQIIYRRLFGTGIYYGPGFAGIDPDDRPVVTRSSEREGCNLLFLALDGHSEHHLWGNDGSTAAGTIDDEHFYSGIIERDKERTVNCRTFEGQEVWNTLCIDGQWIPVNGRGLAIVGPWFRRNVIHFFDGQGQLVSKQPLLVAGEGSASLPAFDPDGVAAWVVRTHEPHDNTRHWTAYSEANREGVEVYSRYNTGTVARFSISYAKVNDLGNVLVSACRKVILFEDVTLQNIVWERFVEGHTHGEEACADPSGAWYVVHYEPETDHERGKVMLARIEADGEIAWDNLIDRPSSVTATHPICDSDGNLYISKWNYLESYATDGSRRWRVRVSDGNVCIHGMNSQGVIYASDVEGSPPYLFAIGESEPHHSRVRVKLPERPAGDVYSPGEDVVVLLQPYNFGEDEVVDGYLAVILPNWAISYYTDAGWSASPTPWFPNVYLPNSFEMIDAPLSLGTIPEFAPEGTYTIIAGFCQPGTLTPVDELFPITFQVVAR